MPKQQIEKRQANHYGVVGDISFDTVITLEKEGMAAINDSDEDLTLDFSQVVQCSSAAMALILSWVRYAKKQDKKLLFASVPSSLLAMIRSAQLDTIIHVQT